VVLDHELPGRKSDKSYAGAMVRYFMAVVVLDLMFVTGYIWFNINSLADLAPIFTDREELNVFGGWTIWWATERAWGKLS
jgi:hypothetical protein